MRPGQAAPDEERSNRQFVDRCYSASMRPGQAAPDEDEWGRDVT